MRVCERGIRDNTALDPPPPSLTQVKGKRFISDIIDTVQGSVMSGGVIT